MSRNPSAADPKGRLRLTSHVVMSWLEDCSLGERIGRGSFGSVFRGEFAATAPSSASHCAVKVVRAATEEEKRAVLREVAFLRRTVEHQNIVRFIGMQSVETASGGRAMRVFLELCICSLADVVRQRGAPLPDVAVLAAAYSIADALAYLHERLHSVHRDVKGANVLLTSTGVVKLSDFNVSTTLSACHPDCASATGTPQYMAPEVIRCERYACPADMWSLGVTVLELAEGRVPHASLAPIPAMFRVVVSPAPTLAQPFEHSPELRALVACLLAKDAAVRLSAPQLLVHACMQPVASAHLRGWVLCQLAWEQQSRSRSVGTFGGAGARQHQQQSKRVLPQLLSADCAEEGERKRPRGIGGQRVRSHRAVLPYVALEAAGRPVPSRWQGAGSPARGRGGDGVCSKFTPAYDLTVSSGWESSTCGVSLGPSTGGLSSAGVTLAGLTLGVSPASPMAAGAAVVSTEPAGDRYLSSGTQGMWWRDSYDLDVLTESTISACVALGR